jgi:hypothetical protein
MPVSQYLLNASDMIRDWSLDRFPRNENKNPEKQFSENPNITNDTWTLAYEFLYKNGQALIQKNKDLYILTKKEYKELINLNYVNAKYHLLKSSFDEFVNFFKKVRLIKLYKENWAKSTCNCSCYLKNYFCYHLIALAANLKLVEIPIQNKKIAIAPKPKKGRKSKAREALQRNLD